MTELPEPAKPSETVHTAYIRLHRKHFGNEPYLTLSEANPAIELFARELLATELEKLAIRYASWPGPVSANVVARKIRSIVTETLDWEPRYFLAVTWPDGRREEYPEPFSLYDDAVKEKEMLIHEGIVTKAEVYYR